MLRTDATHARRLCGALLGLTLLVAACGGDEGAGEADAAPDTTPDAGSDVEADAAPDAAPDAEPDAPTPDAGADAAPDATPDVVEDVPPAPPQPLFVRVDLTPQRAVYRTGILVTPTAEITFDDGTSRPAEEGEVRWSTAPEIDPPASGPRWRVQGEGTLSFIGCVDVSAPEAGEVCGERTVLVDADVPTIVVTAPTAGAELAADDGPLFVRGRVTDTNGEVEVFVNGRAGQLAPNGAFEVRLDPVPGVQHIEVEATDGRQSAVAREALDVLWAPAYAPIAASAPGDGSGEGSGEAPFVDNAFDDALLLNLGQRFVDDRAPLAGADENGVVVTRDLADLVALIVAEADLTTLVPNPVVDESALTLFVDELDLGPLELDLDVTADGLSLFLRLPAALAVTRGSVVIGDAGVSLNGSITAALSGRVDLSVRKTGPDAPLDVQVDDVSLALESATPAFEAPEANAVFALAEGALFGTVEALFLDLVDDAVLSLLPGLVEDLLGTLDELLSGQELPLDLGFGAPITLSLDLPLQRIEPTAAVRLLASLGARVGADAPRAFPDSRGVALLAPPDTPAPLLPNSRVQVLVSMAFLNGVLHTLWDAGLLQIDLSDLLPDELAFLVDGASIDGRLPPIVTVATPDLGDGDLLITLGQAELALRRGEQVDVFGLNLRAPVSVNLVDGVLTLGLPPEPIVTAWVIEVGGDTPIFADSDAIEGLVSTLVWPELAGAIGESLAIEIPSFELGTELADIAPALAGLELALVLDRDIELRDGYLVLDGALEGSVDLDGVPPDGSGEGSAEGLP